jgi:hypothetical protein
MTSLLTADAILARLTEIAKLIESHRAAVFLLEQERVDLQQRLRGAGWTPPDFPEKAA